MIISQALNRRSSFTHQTFQKTCEKRKSKLQSAAETAHDHVTKWQDSHVRKSVVVLVYYIVGCCIFCPLERWSVSKGIYWITVTVTTVGYGDVAPETAIGKLLGIFYILFGLAFIVNIVMGIANAIVQEAVQKAEDMAGDEKEEEDLYRKHLRSLVISIAMILGCMLSGALYFWLSGEFGPLDSIWWSMCTMTTVGYGDLSLEHMPQSMWFSIVFIILSVVVVAISLGNVGAVWDDIAREKREAELLDRMDFNMLRDMDKDGDGVCVNEYVCGMIEMLGLVDKKTMDKFRNQFREHDKDGSGRLDEEDLRIIADEMHAQKEAKKRSVNERITRRASINQITKDIRRSLALQPTNDELDEVNQHGVAMSCTTNPVLTNGVGLEPVLESTGSLALDSGGLGTSLEAKEVPSPAVDGSSEMEEGRVGSGDRERIEGAGDGAEATEGETAPRRSLAAALFQPVEPSASGGGSESSHQTS